MSTAKARVSGAWVDTDLVGAARISSAWVPYGPDDEGPAYEAINWTTDLPAAFLDDGPTTEYHMGCAFTLNVAKPCYGVRWYVPTSLITPSGGYYMTLHQISPDIQIRKQLITPSGNDYMDFLWTVPTDPLLTTETYVVGITTIRYSYRAAGTVGGFPFPSPSGNVSAGIGRLASGGNPDVIPSSNFESIYYISPLIGT